VGKGKIAILSFYLPWERAACISSESRPWRDRDQRVICK